MNSLSSLLTDGIDGTLSSRRVVTFLAFSLCATAFIANLFFGMKIEQFIFDSMSYIAMAGLGATVAEKFSSAERIRVSDRDRYEYQRSRQYPQYPQYEQSTYSRRGTPIPRYEEPLL